MTVGYLLPAVGFTIYVLIACVMRRELLTRYGKIYAR
jgi:hypothetical protein